MLLVKNATILTMDEARRILPNTSIAIDQGRIVEIGESQDLKRICGSADQEVDCNGKIAMPCFINAHTHAFQTLMKGLGEGRELFRWLNEVPRSYAGIMTPEETRAGTLISAVEALKSGTSFLIDNLYLTTSEEAIDAVAEVYHQAGLRAVIARGMSQRTVRMVKLGTNPAYFEYTLEDHIKITEKCLVKWREKTEGRVSVCPSPQAIMSSGPEPYLASKQLSDKYGVYLHTHLAENQGMVDTTVEDYGKREVEFLNDLGVLSPKFVGAHGVWVNDREIDMLARTGACVVHNPVSNMYLASGVMPLGKMLSKGVKIALGSDGGTCGQSHDMFGVMKTAALLHKIVSLNAQAAPSQLVLELATIRGAEALGLQNELGSIEPGKRADITIIDIDSLHIAPARNLATALVYYATGHNVSDVIVDGKIVVQNRKLLTLDEETAVKEARRAYEKLTSKTAPA